METMTSAFPSSIPGHNNVTLDKIIFYSGPASAKTREITSIDTDDWSDIDMIFTEATPQEWPAAAGAQRSDSASRFDTTGGAAQAAVSTQPHFEDVITPLCSYFNDSCDEVINAGVLMMSPKSPDVWAARMESVPAGISDARPLDVQHNGRDVSIAAQDCALDDGANLALWEALHGDGSISATAMDNPASPPRTSETYERNLPLQARGFSPGDHDIDMAPSDKSRVGELDRVQQPQLIGGYEPSIASPSVLDSSPVGQPDASSAAVRMSAITPSSEGSMSDRAHSSRSAATTDAAETEGSDGDEPPLARPRHRTRLCTRDSVSPSARLTPQSSADSAEVKSTTATHRRKRLRRRKRTHPDPPPPKTDDTSTNLTMSTASREGGER